MIYTKEDVIIWNDDERLIEGSKCYLGEDPKILLAGVNEDVIEELTFTGIACSITEGWLFGAKDDTSHHSAKFIIMKKEPEKKIVPYDFSLMEDRNAIIGKRVFHKTLGFDGYIWKFTKFKNGWQAEGMSAEDLKRNAVFVDTGKPVGKEVEE